MIERIDRVFAAETQPWRLGLGAELHRLIRLGRWREIRRYGLADDFPLSEGLANGLRRADGPQRAEALGAVAMVAQILRKVGPRERIEAARQFFDARMAEVSIKTCKGVGCSFCCHMQVKIFDEEAKELANRPYDTGRHQAHLTLPDNAYEFMRSQSWEQAACPFLADGACTVYEIRPLACRGHVSAQDPDRCDWRKYPNGEVGYVYVTQIQVVLSAMYQFENGGTMAKMIAPWKSPPMAAVKKKC